MKKSQNNDRAQYDENNYFNELKHRVLSENKIRPEFVTAVANAIHLSVEDRCNEIRSKADARLNLITAKTGEKMLKGE